MPGAALFCVNPPQPVASIAAPDSARISKRLHMLALRLRKRQRIQPRKRLNGRNRPASADLRATVCLFIAVAPPPSGLFVSIVNCAVTVAFAARGTEMLEKWQLTPAGREAQPKPIVSVNPLTEVRLTVTLAFWVVATATGFGVTVIVKDEPVLVIVMGVDWDGACVASP